MTKTLEIGDLLYHSIHGLCKVRNITKKIESSQSVLYYSLVPKIANFMKHRFVIALQHMEMSGFHAVVSAKEADRILQYFYKADSEPIHVDAALLRGKPFAETNTTWELAAYILHCARNEVQAKDQKQKLLLQRAVFGLMREFAWAYRITMKESAEKIRKNLAHTKRINPTLNAALESAVENE